MNAKKLCTSMTFHLLKQPLWPESGVAYQKVSCVVLTAVIKIQSYSLDLPAIQWLSMNCIELLHELLQTWHMTALLVNIFVITEPLSKA